MSRINKKRVNPLRDEAVAAFEQEMATGSRTWIDDALLPSEAEEFAEQHFIAGYIAGVEATHRDFLHMVGLTDAEIDKKAPG